MRIGIIYMAESPSGKRYYGRSIQPLAKRKYHHNYSSKHGSELYFHRAIRKYGNEIKWVIVEKIKHENKEELLDILIEKEAQYIKENNSLFPGGYNLNKGGGNYGSTGIDRLGKSYEELYGIEKAEKIKKKQRENNAHYWQGKQKDIESVKKSAEGHTGLTHSAQTKEKIKNSLIGVKHTEERRKNISEAHKGKDFSKNFGPVRYGKDHPNFIDLSEKQINKIIRLHTEDFKTSKQIAPIIGVNWAKILKLLKEENSYIEYKQLLKLRKC